MAMPQPKAAELVGSAKPRIAPPMPLRHDLDGYRSEARALGIEPMPWQEVAATYATALNADDRWLYREFAALVARQQGKTTFAKPLITRRLKAGRRIMHIAQVRELPRIMFEQIADALEDTPELFPRRRGKIIWPRRGAGSESIVLTNGGSYRIAAAITGGRGFSFDDLIIDELREMETFDVINAAKNAQKFSEDPQTIYLTNEGTDKAVILDSLFTRAKAGDPSLAFLQWSADPDYDAGDIRGWLQANPAIGHYPQVLRELEQDYTAQKLAGNMAGFETESLCRRVPSMRERLVDDASWSACEAPPVDYGRYGYLGISVDPDRQRASGVVAWREDERVVVRLLFDVSGSPIDLGRLGADVKARAEELRVRQVGFDPLTDAELAKHFDKKAKSIAGQQFANASSTFVNVVRGKQLRWSDREIGDDLIWTAKKEHDETGSFQAVRAKDDRPITASLAAVRAVWLASGPQPVKPRVR